MRWGLVGAAQCADVCMLHRGVAVCCTSVVAPGACRPAFCGLPVDMTGQELLVCQLCSLTFLMVNT